ncbi:MAG TPA: hypothetical protein VNL14_17365 [Candidatus Acidoferrales bacterium]|nr:hypothetical protein [Candidatus Acidoferrales bacterium]
MWPSEQLFLSHDELDRLARTCREPFVAACRRMEIAADLTPWLGALYLPLAAWLDRRREGQTRALVVGVSGAQGSGKTTFSELLRVSLTAGLGRRVASLSIDDFYKTKADREAMAKAVHPLFAARGVPGTHDVKLGIDTIKALQRLPWGRAVPVPAFDKARDDRKPQAAWPIVHGPIDVIIFEGWCVGARPQSASALAEPINDLERYEDSDGTWRRTVNRFLAEEYQRLFSLIDVLLMLKVEGMGKVFEWRRLQEEKLRKKSAAEGLAQDLRIMSDDDLNRFIMHYERLTRHMFEEMPARADAVFFVDDRHNPARVQINKPVA